MEVNSSLKTWYLLRHFGPRWLATRAAYLLKRRSGWLERQLPATPWNDDAWRATLIDPKLAAPEAYAEYRRLRAPRFFFNVGQQTELPALAAKWDADRPGLIERAKRIGSGEFTLFSHQTAALGLRPDWHCSPISGERFPGDRHWSRISDFEYGDIKGVWELSRFAFTYTLVRAYWRTGDEHFAETFWRLIEDWHERNPPQLGPNWKCGQETSFRVMAWCFGLYAFRGSHTSTPQRVTALGQLIAISGQRIAANFDYALSQQNNHGVSEATGLFTIGVLFPELRGAAAWKELGRTSLERLGRELIYDDGSFSQHSFNYQRVMLDDYLWCLRLALVHEAPFSGELHGRIGASAELLYQVQDATTGQVPCYGQNDGAQILPLANCDYPDFRPVIQAVRYFTQSVRCYPPGPWDEKAWWLCGAEALDGRAAPDPRSDWRAPHGGYYTLRSPKGFVFTRCASFRHRPAQADMLQVGVWWRGQNIAVDPGTYSYNAPAPWNGALDRTAVHNVVGVDGQDQMTRAGRFLWLPWVNGIVQSERHGKDNTLAYWQGTHDGYRRLHPSVRCQRAIIRLGHERWLILDRLTNTGEHDYRLHWLLADVPHAWDAQQRLLTLETPAGPYQVEIGAFGSRAVEASLVRADANSARGWRSRYYQDREPALSLAVTCRARSVQFWTLFTPDQLQLKTDETSLQLQHDAWHAGIELSAEFQALIARRIWVKAPEEQAEILL